MASETGGGQTAGRNTYGVTDRQKATEGSRAGWKAGSERVKASYAKPEGAGLYPEYLRARGTRREVGGPTLQA